MEGGYLEVDGIAFNFQSHTCGETPPAAGPVLYQNYPNPFNPATTVSYFLPERGTVHIEILDVAGRFVTRLESGRKSGGLHTVTWHGRDAGGRAVRSGLYLCRMRAGGTVSSRKMILLR